jgi:hypothetical protein
MLLMNHLIYAHLPVCIYNSKFARIRGFHSSLATSEHQLRVSTQSYVVRGTPQFGKLEGTWAAQRLSEVTHR